MSKVTMPEPVILRTVMPDDYRYGNVYGFTRRQMEAYAAAKVREALEQAIAICQAEGDEWGSDSVEIEKNYAHAARDRIRALIPPLPGPVEPTT